MYPKGSGCGVPCDGLCGGEHEELFSIEVGEVSTGATALVVNESEEIVSALPLTRPVIITMCYACIKRLMPQYLPQPTDVAA